MAALASGIIGGAGSLLGGIFGGKGASAAAAAQANALKQVLAFEKQLSNQEQQNIQPFLGAGQGAVSSLYGMLQGAPQGTGPFAPWSQTFQTPTAAQAAAEPGYQFALNQGLQSLQNSAAARGGLLSGQTGQAINNYAQQAAQTNYGNVYNRAFQQYLQNYGQYQQNQQNLFGRYADIAGMGLGAASTFGGQANQLAGMMGQTQAGIGAAQAGGILGQTNALTGALGQLSQIPMQYLMMQNLLGGGGGFTNVPWSTPGLAYGSGPFPNMASGGLNSAGSIGIGNLPTNLSSYGNMLPLG